MTKSNIPKTARGWSKRGIEALMLKQELTFGAFWRLVDNVL
jgi:hypothetical protein